MSADFSDAAMTKAFTATVHKYLRKNRAAIQQVWVDLMKERVYNNTPLVYIRTEALYKGFDVDVFMKSISIRCDATGFNVDMTYWFDTAAAGKKAQSISRPVMAAHLAKRSKFPDINKIFVEVNGPNGEAVEVSLPLFMRTNRLRQKAGWTPVAMSQAVLAGKLVGDFRPPKNANTSYFAAYFTAGPNAPGNPEVYKRGGANPVGGTTRVADRYTILFDFLIMLGLIPDQRNKPSGNGDWIITLRSFTEQIGPRGGRTETAVGALLAACARAYTTIKRGKDYKGKRYTYKRETDEFAVTKHVNRVGDRIRATKAFERFNTAFYGASLASEREIGKQLAAGRMTRTEMDLTPAQIEAIERAADAVTQAAKELDLGNAGTGSNRAQILAQNVPVATLKQIDEVLILRQQQESSPATVDVAEITGTDLNNPESSGQGAFTRKDVDKSNKNLKKEGTTGQIIRDPAAAADLIKQLEENPDLSAMMRIEVNTVDEDTGEPLSWVVIMDSSSEGDWY